MAWLLLILAGALEVAWALGLRSTDGFTRLWPSVWVGAAMVVSMVLLARATREIPTPIAYAVWVGVGVVGAWAISAAFMGLRVTPMQVLSVTAVVAGIIGLKLTSAPAPVPAESPVPTIPRSTA